jgi:hypothetical protein
MLGWDELNVVGAKMWEKMEVRASVCICTCCVTMADWRCILHDVRIANA